MGSAFLVALTGMLVLWRWELVGGVMVVAGMVGFYAINFAATGRSPGGWVFPICFVPGILALASWWTAPPAKLPSRFKEETARQKTGRVRYWYGRQSAGNKRGSHSFPSSRLRVSGNSSAEPVG